MVEEMLKDIVSWYMGNINYWTVFLFMTIESSFIPFPSEIVVPPAAWKAAQGELNVFWVTCAGTAGSIVGAIINYVLALYLGRKVVYSLADTKWAHMMLIDRKGIEKAEKVFNTYGKSSTFFGRLVPAIRQLISLPAGLSRMPLGSFLLFTLLGSVIWNSILAVLGYFLYSQKELLEKYYHELSYAGLGLGIMFFIYIVIKIRKKSNRPAA